MPTSATLPAPSVRPRMPWRAVAVLTGVVIAAHLALLGAVPTAFGPAGSPPPSPQHFITRTIVLAPPAPIPAPTPPAPPPPTVKATPPKPAAPRPTAPPAAEPPSAPAVVQADPAPAPEPETAPPAAAPSTAMPGATGPSAGSGEASGAPSTAASEPVTTPAEAATAAPAPTVEAPVPLRIPGSVRLKFAVTAQQGTTPMQGVFGELNWLQDGSRYDATLALSFFFKTLRQQHSSGAIGPTGIEPDRFSDTRKVEVASHFVRDQGTVVFSNNAPSVPLMPGAQDRLSVVMQLGALMAGDPARYPTGSVIAVQTVGPRDADIWLFTVGEAETLSLPAGQFTARKLTRSPRMPFDDTVEVWVAPDIGYLPVRIKQTQSNGDFADMQLRDQLPAKTPG